MHFFKDLSSILNISTKKGCYICTYDIPNHILETRKGIGYYWNIINFAKLEPKVEYAIEEEMINYEYLMSIEKIIEDIDYEDYIYCNMKNNLETIYVKNNDKKKILKRYNKIK